MGKPAAKKGDQIIGVDIHIVMIPTPVGPVPTPLPTPFSGKIESGVSPNVYINGKNAATFMSMAKNQPPHIPIGGPFQKPPLNQSKVLIASSSVSINFKPAARDGDVCLDCNDPVELPTGFVKVKGKSSVFIGG